MVLIAYFFIPFYSEICNFLALLLYKSRQTNMCLTSCSAWRVAVWAFLLIYKQKWFSTSWPPGHPAFLSNAFSSKANLKLGLK